jgi:hypothetical protein
VSDFRAIASATETLVALLAKGLTGVADSLAGTFTVDARSPKQIRSMATSAGEERLLSVWLYRVVLDQGALNRLPGRSSPGQPPSLPLPIVLHYLVTPLANEPKDVHAVLGLVLQVFDDQAVVRGADLKGSLRGDVDELRVTADVLSLEDHARIWEALGELDQTSLTYQVQVDTQSLADPFSDS